MSMDFDELCDRATELAEDFIHDAKRAAAGQLRLDDRAFYKGWVTEDAIVVHASEDRTLQYYGGFEYVAKEYRLELGSYVVYSAHDERVAKHLDYFFGREEPEEELTSEDIAAEKADMYNDMKKCGDVD